MTIARTQRRLVLAWCVAVSLCVMGIVLPEQPGRWSHTSGALLALLFAAHPAVLGLQAVWAWAANAAGGSDAAPAPAGHWVRAWWREWGASVRIFAWYQPWREHRFGYDAPPQPRRGVLLVHGFVCNRGFWNDWQVSLRAKGVPCMAVTLGPPHADIAQQAQGLDDAWEALLHSTGQAPLLVGHSMGGLLLRSWIRHRRTPAVGGFGPGLPADFHPECITIGTPHRGTALAAWALSLAGRQMRRGSRFLQELEASAPTSWQRHYTCYWSPCDNIVFPARTATLPQADNRRIDGCGHVDLAFQPALLEDVLQRVLAPFPNSPAASVVPPPHP